MMNHRVPFWLSILVLGVGVGGIFLHKNQPEMVTPPVSNTKIENERVIMVAQATRDLNTFDILSPADFKIKSVKVPSDSTDARDISSALDGSVRGYLVRNNIAQGSDIPVNMLESPASPTFLKHSLRTDEMPYSFPIKPVDDYLISSTHTGDKFSVYIRYIEAENQVKSSNIMGKYLEGMPSGDAGIKSTKYVLRRLLSDIPVLESKRYSQENSSKLSFSPENNLVGNIVLRVNQQQLASLRVTENSGDLFLLPATGEEEELIKIKTSDVLPQISTDSVRLLRGTK